MTAGGEMKSRKYWSFFQVLVNLFVFRCIKFMSKTEQVRELVSVGVHVNM